VDAEPGVEDEVALLADRLELVMSCVLISELVALDEAVELVSPINWINTTLEATKAAIAIATMIRVERFLSRRQPRGSFPFLLGQ